MAITGNDEPIELEADCLDMGLVRLLETSYLLVIEATKEKILIRLHPKNGTDFRGT